MHALDVAGALLDHGHVFHGVDDAQDQVHRHVGAAGGRVVVEHDRHADAVADGAVMGEDFRFAEFPVGRGQHHHHIGALSFGETRATHRFSGGQVGHADDGRHAPGHVPDAELADLIPLCIAQVGTFTGAAQRCDGVYAALDQSVDGAPEGIQVNALAVGGERGDGVADDAVNVCGGHGVSPFDRWVQFRQSACWRRICRA
ncbi:hypothetical protein D9M71_229700 [compost metagenome]